jgi:uncharacterized protein
MVKLLGHLRLWHRLKHRFRCSVSRVPSRSAWQFAIVTLMLYGVLCIPFGVAIGFLKFQPEPNPWQWLNVPLSALVMPGILEELVFRVFLLPHPTEPLPPITRKRWICVSWVLFMLYHLPPWTPKFFHELPFLIGAGLLGVICTLCALQSRSMWTAVWVHWAIVVQWLLIWGGLERFQG